MINYPRMLRIAAWVFIAVQAVSCYFQFLTMLGQMFGGQRVQSGGPSFWQQTFMALMIPVNVLGSHATEILLIFLLLAAAGILEQLQKLAQK